MSTAILPLSHTAFLLPAGKANLMNAMASATSPTAGIPGTTTGTTSATTDLGTTFLNLLATELQNQDPTAPVDSTAMVGQMISLNQLDQLISINQSITGTTTSTDSTTPATPATSAASTVATTGSAAQSGSLNPASILASAQAALPFDPNTLMPITTSPSNAASTPLTASSSISGAK